MARATFAGSSPPDVEHAFRELCVGLRSFSELKTAAAALIPTLEQRTGRLEQTAPSRIRLPNGRFTKVHYEAGKPPWIASRLQDFFGMQQSPRIGPGQTPVVIHLLAPNHRAVQTTADLAGFWDRLYPQVRRELMRRYPRHSWPERP
jgi:ATP-dependent helicase HrpB